jgi:hypothetical protein
MKNFEVGLKRGTRQYFDHRPRIIHKFVATPLAERRNGDLNYPDQKLKATTLFVFPDNRLERFAINNSFLPSMTWTHTGKLGIHDRDPNEMMKFARHGWGIAAVGLAAFGLPYVARAIDEWMLVMKARKSFFVPQKVQVLRFGHNVTKCVRGLRIGEISYGAERYSAHSKTGANALKRFLEICGEGITLGAAEIRRQMGVLAGDLRALAGRDEEKSGILDTMAQLRSMQAIIDAAVWMKSFGIRGRITDYPLVVSQFQYIIDSKAVNEILNLNYYNPALLEKYPDKSIVLWFDINPLDLIPANRNKTHSLHAITKIEGVPELFTQTLKFPGPVLLDAE